MFIMWISSIYTLPTISCSSLISGMKTKSRSLSNFECIPVYQRPNKSADSAERKYARYNRIQQRRTYNGLLTKILVMPIIRSYPAHSNSHASGILQAKLL
ncbi:hypothetical protein P875_00108653 [Aspergillus parasiticus SU-1]|uniref:Uncharacterized protein n=1 Tax=Aspergillus parasiticus (strain ATCC 56775 / NRRL 5862 / SRRC 143 / SU-1) TaxID=1403190 RepID=A0A0F0IMW2_ASPPU|nr:hypothetical protein P875_00108653 [Aspergillus parasiticus SU-1]